jgi:hypothetical protein
MGKILNQLITHKNKTKKYVYDETALQYLLTDKMVGDNKTDNVLAEKNVHWKQACCRQKVIVKGVFVFSFPILM